MADDLFTPAISAPPSTARPWRVVSLVYPAFFGGPFAATVLGVLNGRRLGLGAFELRGGEPAPLWWPGLGIAVAGAIVESLIYVAAT